MILLKRAALDRTLNYLRVALGADGSRGESKPTTVTSQVGKHTPITQESKKLWP